MDNRGHNPRPEPHNIHLPELPPASGERHRVRIRHPFLRLPARAIIERHVFSADISRRLLNALRASSPPLAVSDVPCGLSARRRSPFGNCTTERKRTAWVPLRHHR